MAYPCKGCILLVTCFEDCEKIIEYDEKLAIRKFRHKKRCLDCGNLFFKIYTPKENLNINSTGKYSNEYFDHFYMICKNCRTVYLVEIAYWYGSLRKEKYAMFRMGKTSFDETEFITSENMFRTTTLGEDHNFQCEMRANKLAKMIKYGYEK